jgi:TonB-dependent starch-binding outer membrane protein SusC
VIKGSDSTSISLRIEALNIHREEHMHRIALFGLLLLLPALLLAQGLRISGKVTDTKGEPIIGAGVFIQALSLGAATDVEGKYSFTIPQPNVRGQEVELTASIISHKKKSVKVRLSGERITQDFVLEEDVFRTEEVVVTGIASKTSKDIAEVAVSRLPVSNLTTVANYQSMGQLVSGKISGVSIRNTSGLVGAGWGFYMRGGGGINGTGQPTIYIDGVRMQNFEAGAFAVGGATTSNLTNLNVDDIENIDVLKGPAAAAMYGTDGANGVVLITTKSGKSVGSGALSQKPMVMSYRYTTGITEQSWKYTNEHTFYPDLMNDVLGKGWVNEHTFSLAGGIQGIRYYTSFQDRDERGLIPSMNAMNRQTVRLNLNALPANNLSVDVNTSFIWNNLQRPLGDNNIFAFSTNILGYYPAWGGADSLAISKVKDLITLNQYLLSAKATWTPIDRFELSGTVGVDHIEQYSDQLYPFGYTYNESTGSRGVGDGVRRQMTYTFDARYSIDILEQLSFQTVAGAQLSDFQSRSVSINVKQYDFPDIISIGSAKTPTAWQDATTNTKSAGLFWENNFSYANAYMWTLAIRKDYASSIGPEAPSIMYPKVSASVRLDRLDILPSAISMLKLRGAYGENGQLPGLNDAMNLTWVANVGASGTSLNYSIFGNPLIKPERIKEMEFGFDAEFMNMFSLEFTYYNGNSENSILRGAYAPSTGYGNYTYPYNIGNTKNHGFETMLQVTPIRSADYNLSLSFIWNYQTNVVDTLGPDTPEIISTSNVIKPGFKKWEFYDYVSVGPLFDASGKYTGAQKSATKVDLGNPLPDHSGSVTLNFRFLKNFNLYAMGEWGLNNKVYSFIVQDMVTFRCHPEYERLRALLGLSSYGVTGITPLTIGSPEYIDAATKYAFMNPSNKGNFVKDADYFVIRELSLGYDATDLLKEFMPMGYVTAMNVGASVRNLARFSKYNWDFETNSSGSRGNTLASDYYAMPMPRTYNFWVKLDF